MCNNGCNYPLMRISWNYVGNVVTCLKSVYKQRAVHTQIGNFSWDKAVRHCSTVYIARNIKESAQTKFGILTAVTIAISGLWNVTPYSLVDVSEKRYWLHLQIKTDTLCSHCTKKQHEIQIISTI